MIDCAGFVLDGVFAAAHSTAPGDGSGDAPPSCARAIAATARTIVKIAARMPGIVSGTGELNGFEDERGHRKGAHHRRRRVRLPNRS